MKRRRRGNRRIVKVIGVTLGLSGVILIIHTVPLYVWYAALAVSVLLLFLIYYMI